MVLETNGLSVVEIERCGVGDEWFKCCGHREIERCGVGDEWFKCCGHREMWCWRRMV